MLSTMRPTYYHLVVAGHLDSLWAEWFSGGTLIRQPDGTTLLRVLVVDQAMLYGLLARARDLGLTILSLEQIDR